MSEITKQLKSFQNIKPRKDWVDAEREILLSQISARSAAIRQSFLLNSWYLVKSLMPNSFMAFVARPVGVVSLALIFTFSSGALGVNASKGSLPGDLLYPVKLTKEKVQAGLTVSKEKKAEKYVGFAEERSKEIAAIVKEEKNADIKNEKVHIAAAGLKDQLEKAQIQLEAAKDSSGVEVVEVVKKLDEKTDQISAALTATKGEIKEEDNAEIKTVLEEASLKVEAVAVKALEVIVEKHELGEVPMTEQEIVDNLEKKILKAEEQVKQATDKVQVISDTKNTADAAKPLTEGSATVSEGVAVQPLTEAEQKVLTDEKTVSDNLSNIIEKPAQATQAISEAKDLLNHGDLTSVVEKIKETAAIVSEVTTGVANIVAATPSEKTLTEGAAVIDPATATSSDSLNVVASDSATVSVEVKTNSTP